MKASPRGVFSVLGPIFAVFAILVIIRHKHVVEVGIDYEQAWQLGVYRGWLYDFVIACLPVLISSYTQAVLGRRMPWLWVVVALLLVLLSIADLLYQNYFGARLEFWALRYHFADVWTIRQEVFVSLNNPWTYATLFCGLVFVWYGYRHRRVLWPVARPGERRKMAITGTALCLVAIIGSSAASSLETGFLLGGTPISQQVLFSMYRQEIEKDRHEVERRRTSRNIRKEHRQGLARLHGNTTEQAFADQQAIDLLARYQAWDARNGEHPPLLEQDTSKSLRRPLRFNPKRVRELRTELGLTPDRPPNIILLYLETVRAFEVMHPDFGRELMPEFHRLIERHGASFSTAYSSALDAGLTVRGQFSTACSMLPNFEGAATYITHPTAKVRCLGDLAKSAGYQTVWMSGGYKHFHNKFSFESLHGIDTFYDYEYFSQFPEEAPYEGTCGYPDRPFLQRSLDILKDLEAQGKPWFASMLTLSTHTPYSQVAEAPVPDSVLAALSDLPPASEKYLGYLSRLRYLDIALGEFFEALFADPMAAHTAVFILGDHGTSIRSPHSTTAAQRVEQQARIPLAIITRDRPRPSRVVHAVHQVDVAPSIAEVAAWHGEVAWLGRTLFAKQGSAWMYTKGANVNFRAGPTACYTGMDGVLDCFAVDKERDPLFVHLKPSVSRAHRNLDLRNFIVELSRASQRVVARDLVEH